MRQQEELEQFYVNKFYNAEMDNKYSSPYLLSLDVKNLTTDIMFVGQETNEWFFGWDNFKEIGVKEQAQIYKTYHDDYKNHNRLYFSFAKYIMNNDAITPLFNNMFKFDLGDKSTAKNISKAPKEEQEKIITFHQGIFAKELEIIKPKIIIFFTGHVYDKLFIDSIIKKDGNYKKLYKKIDELSVDEWKCCKLDLKQFEGFEHFEGVAFRTYHPMYLNRHKNTFGQEILDYLQNQVQKVLIP